MKSYLIEDIEKIKDAYKKSRRIHFCKNVFLKNTNAKIIFFAYILFNAFYIFIQYFNIKNFVIVLLLFAYLILINILFIIFSNKIIDNSIIKYLKIDKNKSHNPNYLSYLLFIKQFNKRKINISRIELIIEQLELEKDNVSIIDFSKYIFLFTGIILPIILNKYQNIFFKPELIILVLIFGIIFITIFDIYLVIIKKDIYNNNDILKKLKQYAINEKYKKLK